MIEKADEESIELYQAEQEKDHKIRIDWKALPIDRSRSFLFTFYQMFIVTFGSLGLIIIANWFIVTYNIEKPPSWAFVFIIPLLFVVLLLLLIFGQLSYDWMKGKSGL